MNSTSQNLDIKAKVKSRLQRIANVLLLNSSFIDSLGLLTGKTGIAIFLYHYAHYIDDDVFADYANELIYEIYKEINTNTLVDFKGGLTGIGWGIGYLVKNEFIEADTDEVLAGIDNVVYRNMLQNPLLLDSSDDLFGYGLYCVSRLKGYENDDDNLNTHIKKENLIYLTDECERLLIHKRYLEFNILKLSTTTINSILWFLIEMDRLGIFPEKVRRILHCLPDYITVGQKDNVVISDRYILHELVKSAAENISGIDLQKQYQSIIKKIDVTIVDSSNNKNTLLSNLQSISLQKMIYQPYISNTILTKISFRKVFEVIDNEQEWDKLLEGLNKSNLGLMGLAGTGLYLLNEIT